MPFIIPCHFGLRRRRNSKSIPKCLNSSPCASSIMDLASLSLSTAIRCSYELMASASSPRETIIRANVRVSSGKSFAGSLYCSNPIGCFLFSHFVSSRFIVVPLAPCAKWGLTSRLAYPSLPSTCASFPRLFACGRAALPDRRPLAAASSFQVLGGEVPVRQLPEGLDVLGPRIAVVDVVGVLPDIAGQQGLVLGRQRGPGVAGRPQFESSVRHLDEPGPTGAEQADRGFGELFLELLEGPEVFLDALEQRAGRFARGVRAEAVPVEGVVPDLGGVVEDLALGGAHDVLERQVLILGAGNELVQIVHVCLMVLAVVVFEGLG